MVTGSLLLLWLGLRFGPDEHPVASAAVLALVGLVQVAAWHALAAACRPDLDRVPQLTVPLIEVMVGLLCAVWLSLAGLLMCVGELLALRFAEPLVVRWRQAWDRSVAVTRIRWRPSDAAGYYALTRILADQNRPREAAEVLVRLLRRDPANAGLRRQIELLRAQGLAADSRAIRDLLPGT